MGNAAPERGSVSVLVVTGVLLMCLGGVAAADLGSMLVARARAHAAAEAAALAAAVRQAPVLEQEGDPETAAREDAARNGAELLRCECGAGRSDAVVEVAVRPRILLLRGWAGRAARATARAELDPDVLTYRSG